MKRLKVQNKTVLVIGGGPAGSTAASLLARANIEVTLIERDFFPRYHIGESLLPSCLEILEFIGARNLIENYGFQRKPGAYFEWKGEKWLLEFGELRGCYQYSFQVKRAEFDQLLLQHARNQGVKVLEGIKVDELVFSGNKPTGALCYQTKSKKKLPLIEFDYLIDASGRAGIMSNCYLKNRCFHETFKNVAVWGYWKEAQPALVKGFEGAIMVGSIANGWLWAIPFSDGQMSIGVVLGKDFFLSARKEHSLAQIYANAIAASSLMTKISASGTLVSNLLVEQDYSYAAKKFTAEKCFIIGDAACFLDPLLSTGVHLAMYSGLLSAASIASLVHGEISEKEATSYYEQSYRQAYLRFFIFVAAFYEAHGKLGYYNKAAQLSEFSVDPNNLKLAFLNLISGLEDFASAEKCTSHLIGEVSKRVNENLAFRKEKKGFRKKELQVQIEENIAFFDALEGLSALSPAMAINGLYVSTSPLGLRRT